MRRTSTWPSDPVPPVTSTFLPSNGLAGDFTRLLPPRVVRRRVFHNFGDQLGPVGASVAGGSQETVSHHRPVANFALDRHDFDVQPVCLANEAQQFVFADGLSGHLVESMKHG